MEVGRPGRPSGCDLSPAPGYRNRGYTLNGRLHSRRSPHAAAGLDRSLGREHARREHETPPAECRAFQRLKNRRSRALVFDRRFTTLRDVDAAAVLVLGAAAPEGPAGRPAGSQYRLHDASRFSAATCPSGADLVEHAGDEPVPSGVRLHVVVPVVAPASPACFRRKRHH